MAKIYYIVCRNDITARDAQYTNTSPEIRDLRTANGTQKQKRIAQTEGFSTKESRGAFNSPNQAIEAPNAPPRN